MSVLAPPFYAKEPAMPLSIHGQYIRGNHILKHLLDEPNSIRTVQSLSADALLRLIDHIGLEDAGEILMLSTTQQLLALFDRDLWHRHEAGEDEQFNADRFLLWLDILLEGGEERLVSKLTELPVELLYLAFHSHIIVLNLDDLATQMSTSEGECDIDDKALESALGHELDEYYIVARKHEGWDALFTTILALYERETDLTNRILSRCCHTDWETIEENGGLYNVLTAAEMLDTDAAADRADRRAKSGYIAPSDAMAFLKLSKIMTPKEIITQTKPDPITKTYFREWERQERPSDKNKPSPHASATPTQKPTSSDRIHDLLQAAGVLESNSTDINLLPVNDFQSHTQAQCRYQTVFSNLSEADPEAYEQQTLEVTFLANIIDSGLSSTEAPIRIADALKAVFDVCDVALRHIEQHPAPSGNPTSSITLFKLGWHILTRNDTIKTINDLHRCLQLKPS